MSDVRVPTGGQLLGGIVRAFQLHDVADPRLRDVVGKRGQRFFAEGRKVRHACGPICLLGWVVVGTPICNCGRSPEAPQLFKPVVFPQPLGDAGRLFVLSAHAHALSWDRLVRPLMAERPELAIAFVRFGTLDLAVKTALFRLREGLPPPSPGQLPAWAEPTRHGEPLEKLLEIAERPSLEEVAARARVSVDAIKRWRRAERRPTGAKLTNLLAEIIPENRRASVTAMLSRHYALAAIAQEVCGRFGDGVVRELARVFTDVVACQMATFQTVPDHVAAARDRAAPFLLAVSSWYLPADVFLRIADHHAAEWRSDIATATELWKAPLAGSSPQRELDLLNWLRHLHGEPQVAPG